MRDLRKIPLLMFENQKPLAAATRGCFRVRISPDRRSIGGFSSANIKIGKEQ
jgi:hypothetical protein